MCDFGNVRCGCAVPHGNFGPAHMKRRSMGPFHLGIRQASNALAPRFRRTILLTTANQTDEKELRTVIGRSFVARHLLGRRDSRGQRPCFDGWLERAFEPEESGICLALRHGLRMIGASILIPDPAAGNHLTPGPCVLMEYRNRGLGTALLEESLRQLRDAGLVPCRRAHEKQRAGREISLPEVQRGRDARRHAGPRRLIVSRLAPCGLG